MEKHELTCIRCPVGCALTVTVESDKVTVTGNSCPQGAEYGVHEVTRPMRTVTSSVRVTGGALPLVSVKTVPDIPKEAIFAVMEAVRAARVPAPVKIGDVLIRNAAGMGSDIVATKDVDAR
ncbi:MAG: DUF1667 domain-containing protein [Clostridia bacterium]|nr:DUF1667 domain-containing protein [Clostridia bacterium]